MLTELPGEIFHIAPLFHDENKYPLELLLFKPDNLLLFLNRRCCTAKYCIPYDCLLEVNFNSGLTMTLVSLFF